MKVIIGKSEVENAVECYLNRQGIDTDKYNIDIKIVVSRSSEDTKIEIDMVEKTQSIPNTERSSDNVPEEVVAAPFAGSEN